MKKEFNLLNPFSETVFNDSKILTTEQQRKFVKSMFVGVVIASNVKRLYRATDQDVGFSGSKFHSLCDNKGCTLSIIKTVAGHTFGGYTSVNWESSGGNKTDYHSFVFTVDK